MLTKIYLHFLHLINQEKYARKIGVQIGSGCRLLGWIKFGSEPYLIQIGNHVSISDASNFVTHEGAHWVLKGLNPQKYNHTFGFGRICVGNNVYIGYGVTILRGVTIGDNCIIGAQSLVTKSLPANGVYAGVPAKRICSLEEWEKKFMADMPSFNLANYKANKKQEILNIIDQFKPR